MVSMIGHRYFASESILPGHPDKMCDQISDAIVDAILKKDKFARIAVDTTLTKGICNIFGEITTKAKVDYEHIARNVMKDVGYISEEIGLDYKTCDVYVNTHEQSPEIAKGLLKKEMGAGDQGIMFGYAINHTDRYMPLPITLAHSLAKRVYELRTNKVLPYLRPDGKVQITMELEDGIPFRIDSIILALQNDGSVSKEKIEKDLIEKAIIPIGRRFFDEDTKIYINHTGKFITGGPAADSGLTGKKTIVDTYGGWAHNGGGCLSGKDPTKVDRSSTYMVRFLAKNIIAQKFADEIEIEVAYVIGRPKPVALSFDTKGTEHISLSKIENIIKKFSFKPDDMIKILNLLRPIYQKTANFGHFGRKEFPWEKIKPKTFKIRQTNNK